MLVPTEQNQSSSGCWRNKFTPSVCLGLQGWRVRASPAIPTVLSASERHGELARQETGEGQLLRFPGV